MSKFLGNLKKKKKEEGEEKRKKKGSLQFSPSNQDTSIIRFHFNKWNLKVSSKEKNLSEWARVMGFWREACSHSEHHRQCFNAIKLNMCCPSSYKITVDRVDNLDVPV